MDEHQTRFVDSNEDTCILIGIPGGGKTRCIIEKVKQLADSKAISKASNFLVLNFTKCAQNDMLSKKDSLSPKYAKFFNSKNIITLHSLAGTINNKLSVKNPSGINLLINHIYIELSKGKDADVKAVRGCIQLKSCHTIFVDEAQDLDMYMYYFVSEVAKIIGCKLILVGDPNQTIFQFREASNKYLLDHGKLSNNIFKLVNNYRSSKPIVDFLNHFRPYSMSPIMYSAANNGTNIKPKLVVDSYDNMIMFIINDIKKSISNREELSEIAIIGPVKKSKPSGDTYKSFGLNLMLNMLNEHNIKFCVRYAISGDTGDVITTKGSNKRERGKVNIYTSHGSKGLEFDKVYLLNFHFNTHTRSPTREDYENFKYLWYVGLSRAKKELYMFTHEASNVWPELNKCPRDLYEIIGREPMRGRFFLKEPPLEHIGIMDLIRDRKLIPSSELYFLVDALKIKFVTKKMSDRIAKKVDASMTKEIQSLSITEIDEGFDEGFDDYEDLGVDDDEAPGEIVNFDSYAALYGIFVEDLFTYYKYLYIGEKELYIKQNIEKAWYMIVIPDQYMNAFKQLNMVYPIASRVSKDDLLRIDKSKLNDLSMLVFEYIKDKVVKNSKLCSLEYFTVVRHNKVQNWDTKYVVDLLESIRDLDNNDRLLWDKIFHITLFYFQISNEVQFLLNEDFTEELDSLVPYCYNVKDWASSVVKSKFGKSKKLRYTMKEQHGLHRPKFGANEFSEFCGGDEGEDDEDSDESASTKYEVNKYKQNPMIKGVADLMVKDNKTNKSKIVEIKFSHQTNVYHGLQVILYSWLNGNDEWLPVEVWNFYSNTYTKIGFKKLCKRDLHENLCKIFNKLI